jgi:haloalkane dehalogenase
LQNYAKWLRETEIPKLCLYITPGVGFQAEDLKVVTAHFKNTKVVNLGEGLHFLQEDYPHEIGEEVSKWLKEI